MLMLNISNAIICVDQRFAVKPLVYLVWLRFERKYFLFAHFLIDAYQAHHSPQTSEKLKTRNSGQMMLQIFETEL